MQTGKGEQNFWQEEPQQAPQASAPQMQSFSPPTDQPPVGFPSSTPFTPPELNQPPAVAPADPQAISWQASEFIYHQKSPLWFVVLGIVAVGLLALALLVLKDWFIVIGLIFMIVAVGVVANRRPRILQYSLDDTALHVGERSFPYHQFQSFSVNQEGQLWSVSLLPSGRFKPRIIIYFEEAQGEQIVDTLGNYLPMEEHKPDFVDKISTKIRF